MSAPVRLRLSRARGFDLQAHSRAVNGRAAVNVARPGIFGNPFVVGEHGTRAECVDLHVLMISGWRGCTGPGFDAQRAAGGQVVAHLASLRGKNLACWCALDGPCHGDTLLRMARLWRGKPLPLARVAPDLASRLKVFT